MTRVIMAVGLTLASATVAILVRARAYTVAQGATQASQSSTQARPLILQPSDGDHLVRRAGPTAGWPFTMKLDGQNGNT